MSVCKSTKVNEPHHIGGNMFSIYSTTVFCISIFIFAAAALDIICSLSIIIYRVFFSILFWKGYYFFCCSNRISGVCIFQSDAYFCYTFIAIAFNYYMYIINGKKKNIENGYFIKLDSLKLEH